VNKKGGPEVVKLPPASLHPQITQISQIKLKQLSVLLNRVVSYSELSA